MEITGPADRKMIINALNAPVHTFMADFEDSCSPTWDNLLSGQVNLVDAVRRRIAYTDPVSGKSYRLNERTATLIVRPRGWHLPEKHVRVDGQPVSGALFDFATLPRQQPRSAGARRHRPLFLSAQAGEPPGSAPVERRLRRGRAGQLGMRAAPSRPRS